MSARFQFSNLSPAPTEHPLTGDPLMHIESLSKETNETIWKRVHEIIDHQSSKSAASVAKEVCPMHFTCHHNDATKCVMAASEMCFIKPHMELLRRGVISRGDCSHLNLLNPNLQRMVEFQIGIAELQADPKSAVGHDWMMTKWNEKSHSHVELKRNGQDVHVNPFGVSLEIGNEDAEQPKVEGLCPHRGTSTQGTRNLAARSHQKRKCDEPHHHSTRSMHRRSLPTQGDGRFKHSDLAHLSFTAPGENCPSFAGACPNASVDGKPSNVTHTEPTTPAKSGKTTKKKNIDWNSTSAKNFETRRAAKSCLQKLGELFMRSVRTNRLGKHHFTEKFGCGTKSGTTPVCQARILSPWKEIDQDGAMVEHGLDDECEVTLQFSINPNCNCRQNGALPAPPNSTNESAEDTTPQRNQRPCLPRHAVINDLVHKCLKVVPPKNPSQAVMWMKNELKKQGKFEQMEHYCGSNTKLNKKLRDYYKYDQKKIMEKKCPKVNFVADLTARKQGALFVLPKEPVFDCSKDWKGDALQNRNEHMRQKAEELHRQKKLNIVENMSKVHKCACDMTYLEGEMDPTEPVSDISMAEQRLCSVIHGFAREGGTHPHAWKEALVVTSFSFLWHLVDCHFLRCNITGSTDGTEGTNQSSWSMLNFGCFSVHRQTTSSRSFRPFACVVCPSESQVYFCIALVTVLKHARRLFGIKEMEFRGMLVSNHCQAFVNAFRIAFPNTTLAQCFPHIRRKFTLDKKGNGAHNRHCDGPTIPHWVCEDVWMLRACGSKKMFRKMWSLVRDEWSRRPEMETVLSIFEKSHMTNDEFNVWFIRVSGLPCCFPDNNPNERHTQLAKGTEDQPGHISTNKDMGECLDHEMPNMVSVFGDRMSDGVERKLKIDDRDYCVEKGTRLSERMSEHTAQFDPMIDCNMQIDKNAPDGIHCLNTIFNIDEPYPPRNSAVVDVGKKDPLEKTPNRGPGTIGCFTQKKRTGALSPMNGFSCVRMPCREAERQSFEIGITCHKVFVLCAKFKFARNVAVVESLCEDRVSSSCVMVCAHTPSW